MEFEISNIDNIRTLFSRTGKTVGIGVNAFDSIDPIFFCPDYKIVCLSKNKEDAHIRSHASIFCISEHRGQNNIEGKRSTSAILMCRDAAKHIISLDSPNLFLYRHTEKIKRICEKQGILNRHPMPIDSLDKIFARKMFEKCGFGTLDWETKKLAQISYFEMKNKYGSSFVLQTPSESGGRGTFFIDSEQDLFLAKKRIAEMFFEKEMPEILVTRFVGGFSPSITCCITGSGVLYTAPQHQILDVQECTGHRKGSGIFCGHEWGQDFQHGILEQIYGIAEKVGQHMKQIIGYRGVFGIDFVVDEKTTTVHPIECNFRLLGSFPNLTMQQVQNNEIPLSALHILENNSISYTIDADAINTSIKKKKSGSQLFLSNRLGAKAIVCGDMEAGVYELKNGNIEHKRQGLGISDIKTSNEFVLAGGVPFRGAVLLPNQRLFRILSKQPMYDIRSRKLLPETSRIIEAIYEKLDIRAV